MATPQKPIALLGGAFDPIHNGHLLIIAQLLNSQLFSHVWIVPTGDDRSDKAKPVASGVHRVAMIEAALASDLYDNSQVGIETVQLDGVLPAGSRTVDLLEHLTDKHIGKTFSFIIGADRIATLPEWKEFDRLKAMTRFLAFPRLGEAISENLPEYVTLFDCQPIISSDISSSAVRRIIEDGKSTAGCIPVTVAKYVAKYQLYILGANENARFPKLSSV